MQSPKQTNTSSPGDSSSPTEYSPPRSGFFNNLRALDHTQFKTPLDDFNASLPEYYVANPTAPVYDPALSVSGWQGYHQAAGQLENPEATVYNSWEWNNSYTPYPDPYQPTMPQHQYFVPQDRNIPSSHYDSSYIGYSNPSLHSTRQELNVNSHFDSCAQLHSNHINMGALNCDAPSVYAMQQNQEPGSLKTSGYYIPTQYKSEFITPSQGSDVYYYTQLARETQRFDHISLPVSSSPVITPSPFSTLHPSPTIVHPTSVSTPPSVSVPVSNPASLPTPPTPVSSFPSSLPSSQLIQLRPAPVLPEPKKKRVHQPRKPAPAKVKKSNGRGLSNGRPQPKSAQWLNKYMPRGDRCTLCQRGPECDRLDRRLEHLVSTHILQVVKNVETFNADHFGISKGNLISTKVQFDLARQYVALLKCSFCGPDNSLVIRKGYFKKHLDGSHQDVLGNMRDLEDKRVQEVMKPKEGFYDFSDEFLYKFFHV